MARNRADYTRAYRENKAAGLPPPGGGRAGRPRKADSEKAQNVTISLSAELLGWVDSRGGRSEVIAEAVSKLRESE